MAILPNGDIVPSFLGITRTPNFSDGGTFDNVSLRMGEIQDTLYPDNKLSRSKKFIEYNVLVQQRSNRTGNGKIYENCLLANLFGGLADKFTYTLRADKPENISTSGLGKGSKVLVLCVNGQSSTALIIGGVHDQADVADEDIGHNLAFNFNGMSATINKDGELTLTYGGKTEIDGTTKVDSSKTGSTVSLLQNGNIAIGDKDLKNALTIDHENSKVTIARDSAFELGAATDKMLLGQSFRDAQKQMNNQVKSYSDTVKNLLQNAGQALTTASVKNAVPVTGGAASAGDFAQAGALLIAASQIMGQISQAIGDFENAASAKNSFVSKRNSAD